MRKLEKDANADRFRKEVTYEREMRDLGWFGLIEMLLETLPQCSLQTYVGVSYGQFEESYLPIFSVAMGFLAGGATIFGVSKCRLRLPVAAQSWQDSREALVTTSSLFRHDSDLALDLLQSSDCDSELRSNLSSATAGTGWTF